MAADLQFTIMFDSNGVPVLKNISDGLQQVTAHAGALNNLAAAETVAFGAASAGAAQVGARIRDVRPLLFGASAALAGAGEGANLLSHGLTSLLFAGINPVGIGLAALTVTIGVGVAVWKHYTDAAKEAQELQVKFAATQIGFQHIQEEISAKGALANAENDLDKLKVVQDQERRQLKAHFDDMLKDEKLTYDMRTDIAITANENMQKLLTVQATQFRKTADAALDVPGKAQEAIRNEITARQFQTAAIGRTGQAVDALALAQKLAADDARVMAGENGAMIAQLKGEEVQAYKVKTAYDALIAGRAEAAKFQQDTGVKLEGQKSVDSRSLADTFVNNYVGLIGDPKNAKAINAAFATLIQKAIDEGLPDIPAQIARRLSGTDFSNLKEALPKITTGFEEQTRQEPILAGGMFSGKNAGSETITELVPTVRDLKAELNNLLGVGLKSGEELDKDYAKFQERLVGVGDATMAAKKDLEDLDAKVIQKRAVDVDVSKALSDLQSLTDAIDELTAGKHTVFIDVQSNIGQIVNQLDTLANQTTGRSFFPRILN